MYTRICLRCGREIDNGLWHKKCIRDFFDSDTIPDVSLDLSKLKSLAISQIDNHKGLTGVQEKLSLHLDLSNSNRPRLTIIGFPSGYILKPQAANHKRLPEFEHTAMLLAESCGLNVVKHGLILINENEYAYITKRVDRSYDTKIHMEDFCQASGTLTVNKYRSSYEECGMLIDKYSKDSLIDKVNFFRCVYFSFVIGNSDLHLKNFSFIMDEQGKFSLAPFYDLLPTKLIITSDHEDLGMLLNGKKQNLAKKDFDAFASSINISEMTKNKIIKSINTKFDQMSEIINNSTLDSDSKIKWIRLISANIRRASK